MRETQIGDKERERGKERVKKREREREREWWLEVWGEKNNKNNNNNNFAADSWSSCCLWWCAACRSHGAPQVATAPRVFPVLTTWYPWSQAVCVCMCVDVCEKHLWLRGLSVAESLISSVIQNLVTRCNTTAARYTHTHTLYCMSFVLARDSTKSHVTPSADKISQTPGDSFNVKK